MKTKDAIMQKAKHLFATQGYEGVSMRSLAEASGITLSSIYHYFPSKDHLLDELFHTTNTSLGKMRNKLPKVNSASDALRQRIEFQFEHAEDVVYVLKYYLTFREKFEKNKDGFLPPKTYLHIEEVINQGNTSGEFKVSNAYEDSQVIAHSINGFVLEYFPHKLSALEKEKVVQKIHRVLMKALTTHET